MSLTRKLGPYLTAVLVGPRTRKLQRTVAEAARRLRGAPHRVTWFHQVDDPYSALGAQRLGDFLARYDVGLEPVLVGPPPDAAAPERERGVAFARRDAQDVAPAHGLVFRDPGAQPAPEACRLAGRVLLAAAERGTFADLAPAVGKALWDGTFADLEALAAAHGSAGVDAYAAALARGDALRAKRGHYNGAMFHYGGEWYWGLDRLAYLEERLDALGARRADAPEAPAARCDRAPGSLPASAPRDAGLVLEFYPSLRSPYTAICFERVHALVDRYGLELSLRPVLPMVMRGLPVPRAKRLYIVRDTAREAERVCEPFGFMADPVGRPVERGFSLWPRMRDAGVGPAYLHAFARAAFAEGIDLGSDAGLRRVVEQVGVDWREVAPHLDAEGWRDELEHNRETLLGLGLWGVPSFRLRGPEGSPDYATWGQDRIWRVEQEIVKRLS